MIFLLHTDPNLVTYLSPMLLHDPVAKVKASASYGTHLQADDPGAVLLWMDQICKQQP